MDSLPPRHGQAKRRHEASADDEQQSPVHKVPKTSEHTHGEVENSTASAASSSKSTPTSSSNDEKQYNAKQVDALLNTVNRNFIAVDAIIKELQSENEELRSRNNELSARCDHLSAQVNSIHTKMAQTEALRQAEAAQSQRITNIFGPNTSTPLAAQVEQRVAAATSQMQSSPTALTRSAATGSSTNTTPRSNLGATSGGRSTFG